MSLSPDAVIQSAEVFTSVPLTLQLTGLVSTDGLRVKSHVILNDVPAYRGALRLVMDTAGAGTMRKVAIIYIYILLYKQLHVPYFLE